MDGGVRKTMLSSNFNLRAEVAAALLDREEDMKLFDGDMVVSSLSPSFSATYRVLDMSTPQSASSKSVLQSGRTAAASASATTTATSGSADARKHMTSVDDSDASPEEKRQFRRQAKPAVQIYGSAAKITSHRRSPSDSMHEANVMESPVSGLVADSTGGRVSLTDTNGTLDSNKKRMRRVSAPTTSIEFREEEAQHPPSNALHDEIVEDVAEHLTLVPSLQTQWARWRLYRVAEEKREEERREQMSTALSSWRNEVDVRSVTRASSSSPSSSRFSRKAIRQLVRLRVQYGKEVDTARWRLSSWSWFAKHSRTREQAIDIMARHASTKLVYRLFKGWRKDARDVRNLNTLLQKKAIALAGKCLRVWQRASQHNLSLSICLTWLLRHKLSTLGRRCIAAWRSETRIALLRTEFLYTRASQAGSLADKFHVSVYAVLRTWRENAQYQRYVTGALSNALSLRALRAMRRVLFSWRNVVAVDREMKSRDAHTLVEAELLEVRKLLQERIKASEAERQVFETEKISLEEQLKSSALARNNLATDGEMARIAIRDAAEREEVLRCECDRLRSEMENAAVEREALTVALDSARSKTASLEQSVLKGETKIAVETERYDSLVSEIDTVRARLSNEEEQSAAVHTRCADLQHLLESEAKRNSDLVNAMREAETKARALDSSRLDELEVAARVSEDLQHRLDEAQAACTAHEASLAERAVELSAAMSSLDAATKQLEDATNRERAMEAILAKTNSSLTEEQEKSKSSADDLRTLSAQCTEYELYKTRTTLEHAKLTEKLKHSQSELNEVKCDFGTEAEKVRALLATVAELRETVTTLKGDIATRDQAELQLTSAKDSVAMLQREAKEHMREIDERRREAIALRRELEAKEAARESLAEELNRSRDRGDIMRADIAAEAKKHEEEMVALRKQVTDIADEKIRTEVRLRDTQTRLASVEDVLSEDETQLHDVRSELAKTRQMLDTSECERTQTAGECDSLRADLLKASETVERHQQAELETKHELQRERSEKAVLEQSMQVETAKMTEIRKEYNAKMMELASMQTLAEESKLRAEANSASLAKVRERLVNEEKSHNELIAVLSHEKDGLLRQIDDQKAKIDSLTLEIDSMKASHAGANSPMMPSIVSQMQHTIKEKNAIIAGLRSAAASPAGSTTNRGLEPESARDEDVATPGRKRSLSGRKKSVEDIELEKAVVAANQLSNDVKRM